VRTFGTLSHPHILKLFDFGRQGDLLYLVTELLTGGSLADRIRNAPLSLDEARRVMEPVAFALDFAHGQGVIHCDLKPQNVLLDAKNNPYLTDFGVAKLLDESTVLTQGGTAMGTPAYMAPEQWQGAELDARTDVYALGVMLFEMLSGRLPFQGDTPFSMMNMHVYAPPPPLRVYRPDLPNSVEKVIRKALAEGREHRFQSAGDMARAFAGAIGGKTPPGLDVPLMPTADDVEKGLLHWRRYSKSLRSAPGRSFGVTARRPRRSRRTEPPSQ
jgi:serine/threonine-protein kinase